jgi:hypothetical protein
VIPPMVCKMFKAQQSYRLYVNRGRFAKSFDRQQRIGRVEALETERLATHADVSQPEARIAALEEKDGERTD